MEQNTQAGENNNQVEGGVIFRKPRKKSNKKIVLLVLIVIAVLGIASYFLFFSNKEDNNTPVLENENVEESKIDKELDSDQDGLPDYIEKVLGTDVNNSDTDGDGYSDFEEIKNGYNPFDDKKYTEEEWEGVKEEIKSENEKLFGEMFGDFGKTIYGCDAFPDKLDLCETFSCEFEHPFTGEMMERKIIGLVNGKCQYTEEMPNNGKMDCEYSESLRKAIAQYYRDLAIAESVGTNIEANLGSGDVKTTYTIDGKEVENPLQEAMDSGECIISGYGNSEINYNLEVDIKFPKNTYEFDEILNGEYYLKYEGESFKGILSASLSKDGFVNKSFSAMIETTIKAQPRTMVNEMIFAEKAVECEGTYTYTFSVYDCVDIDDALDTQGCGGDWKSGLQEMIENKVEPVATSSEVISVICKGGKESCAPVNYVWACDNFGKECKEGYKCEQYKCVLE